MPKNDPAPDKPAQKESTRKGQKSTPAGADVEPVGAQRASDGTAVSRRHSGELGDRPSALARTRISAAWAAVAVAVVVLVLLLVFILQNLDPVTVTYFGATAQMPLGVLLLFAACGGALLVIVLGIARMLQLHWLARRDRRQAAKNGTAAPKP